MTDPITYVMTRWPMTTPLVVATVVSCVLAAVAEAVLR